MPGKALFRNPLSDVQSEAIIQTSFEFCNGCSTRTSHKWIFNQESKTPEDVEVRPGETVLLHHYNTKRVLACQGCGVSFYKTTWWFEDWSHETDRPEEHRYPAEQRCRVPGWMNDPPDNLRPFRRILDEVYKAIQSNCFSLASSGIRTVLDTIFVEKVGDLDSNKKSKKFETKVNEMIERGFLAAQQKETIIAVIEAGNASAHRGFVPDIDLLRKALRITESLLESLYIHPDDAHRIQESTPQRRRGK